MSKAEIEAIMRDWPELTFTGFHHREFREPMPESEARKVEDRSRMLADDAPEQFNRCLRYIAANLEIGPRRYPRATSYGLKHRVERWYEAQGIPAYVSNGMFIAAMVASGFRVCKIDGPNAYFNITPVSMKKSNPPASLAYR